MKVLLDHCVAEPFRRYLPGHEVVTARFARLAELEDGPMLARAQELGFQAVVTVDTGIPFQQNVSQMRLAVVVLHVWRNNLDRLIPLAPAVLETLTNAAPGRVYHVHDAAATR